MHSVSHLAPSPTCTSIITTAGMLTSVFSPRPPHICHTMSSAIKCTLANTHVVGADASADDLLQARLSSLLTAAACFAQHRHWLLHAVGSSAAQLCSSCCRQQHCAERCCRHTLPCRPGKSCNCLAGTHRPTRSAFGYCQLWVVALSIGQLGKTN